MYFTQPLIHWKKYNIENLKYRGGRLEISNRKPGTLVGACVSESGPCMGSPGPVEVLGMVMRLGFAELVVCGWDGMGITKNLIQNIISGTI